MLWAFIREGLNMGHKQELYDVIDQRILGSADFVDEIKSKIKATHGLDHLDDIAQPLKTLQNLTEILNIVSDVTEIPRRAILGNSRQLHISKARGIFSYVAVKYAGFDNRTISHYINKDPSGVTHMVRRIETLKKENLSLNGILEKVIQLIQV